MKKVLSVAMASAMVLGMGANAFAIQYNTGSNDKAAWPKDFQFDGALFVTDKNGDIITKATTAINDNEAVDFQPGDVIWMPLYAKDQLAYTNDYTEGKGEVAAITSIRIDETNFTDATGEEVKAFFDKAGGKWYTSSDKKTEVTVPGGHLRYIDKDGNVSTTKPSADGTYTVVKEGEAAKVVVPTSVDVNDVAKVVESAIVTVDGRTFSGKPEKVEANVNAYLETLKNTNGAYVARPSVSGTVSTAKEEAIDDVVGKPHINDTTAGVVKEYGHYTGNIDKNWSINLIEKSTGVAELVEKAELYKATANDYASYSKYTNEIMPKAVYLKITLKKEWKTVSNETLKYYVYVADNKNNNKTNEVWVSGKYAPTYRTVDFTWTNNANEAGLWKAEENGVAVFDFADKAFFTVKMYKGETMFLDLSTAYDKVVAGEMDVEADSFYKFDKTNASFARTGELVIVSDDDTLVPYEIDEDGNFVAVDAEYVKDYAIAHTNSKVNGFVFKTNQLGNYVLATEELGEEEAEEVEETEEAAPAPVVDEKPAETAKPNPNTGAEDFVGLAVSLAVVSVAAAGALALKK